MTWFKVDDNLATHMKVIQAGNEAMGLWVRAGSWAAQQLTDGYVPNAIVTLLGGTESADTLVNVGLWHLAQDGYEFNDWGVYQPTRQSVMGEREAAKERQRKYREGRTIQTHEPEKVSHPITKEAVKKVPTTRGTRIPNEFHVTPEMQTWFDANIKGINSRIELEKFIDYWTSQPGQKGVKTDWVATWRNWMRRASESSKNVPQAEQDEALERWRAEREERIANQAAEAKRREAEKDRYTAPPECKHGISIMRCLPCQKELAESEQK